MKKFDLITLFLTKPGMALSCDDLKQAFYKRLLSSTPQRFAGMLGGATAGNFIRIDPKTRMVECIR